MGRNWAVWKRASGVVIGKPGNEEYTQLEAYHSISLWSCMINVIKKVVAELLSEEAERRELVRDTKFGRRTGRSAIDALAIMIYRAHAVWKNGYTTGVLLLDMKTAFPHIPNGRLFNLLKVRKMVGNHVLWAESFLEERRVGMLIEGNAMERRPVEAGVLPG
jgi:hypothetical protein